jgi:hypothetical protein
MVLIYLYGIYLALGLAGFYYDNYIENEYNDKTQDIEMVSLFQVKSSETFKK